MLYRLAFVVALGCASPAAFGQSSTGVLAVAVPNVRSDSGHVYCALYASRDGFPHRHRNAVAGSRRPASKGTVTCSFGAVPEGEYAVAVIHDENGNGRLDTGLFGIPKEGWGVSNDAGPRAFGPPRFAAARFRHGAPDQRITIHMRY